jgi:hypothetical protein
MKGQEFLNWPSVCLFVSLSSPFELYMKIVNLNLCVISANIFLKDTAGGMYVCLLW